MGQQSRNQEAMGSTHWGDEGEDLAARNLEFQRRVFGVGPSGAGSLGMLLQPVSRGAALLTGPGADGGGPFGGSQLGAGSGAAGAAGGFLRPDSRGAALATRQVSASPRQSDSPSTTMAGDEVTWEDNAE